MGRRRSLGMLPLNTAVLVKGAKFARVAEHLAAIQACNAEICGASVMLLRSKSYLVCMQTPSKTTGCIRSCNAQ